MNVDILCEYGSLNGGEHSMLALLPLLRRRGVELRVIAPPHGPLSEVLQTLDIELIPFPIAPEMPLDRKQELLGKTLWNRSPELLHANSLSMARLSGPIVSNLCIPSIAHLRDIIRLNRTVIRDVNRHRRFLAVSEATRCFHVEQGLDATRCHVLYNGVDLERFRPRPADGYLHRELGIPTGARLLSVIGQIGLRKGQDMLLEALDPVFERRKDVHLLVVGRRWSEKDESIRFEENLRSRVLREPFRDRVHFLGLREDISRLLNESTLLVHAARQEPLGRVLLEAAASGVAVVATEVGGTSEIFPRETDSACVVAPGRPETFGRAVLELLDSEERRRRLAVAARRRAEAVFDRENTVENLLHHYKASKEAGV